MTDIDGHAALAEDGWRLKADSSMDSSENDCKLDYLLSIYDVKANFNGVFVVKNWIFAVMASLRCSTHQVFQRPRLVFYPQSCGIFTLAAPDRMLIRTVDFELPLHLTGR